ncbi:protein translocase subunit SecF [Candidatus Woesearchaeota archaeon]|jgi:preprotein translocase subunit SecF|nr:protein translocase subunit SecF [Candidatus Woesearchaeota archaeon]MBT4110293.1 protein translocase subunit SecF [Candidatus Woesearchaeota archaeon]MBT4336183.1 protein translocase subunit SecF [Candidatus Woesearchaeota archaeon]MBT4468838.1 protein translocase subunit SecF [Candidatus Woesearchaeota archaeon]MBT6744843.1 protein translocase subunit SecF [Candidatus Woesearchaeota archaeon]
MKNKIKNIYENKYKILLIIPFLLLVLALVQIGLQATMTDSFVNKGITLKGGSTVTIENEFNIDSENLELFLQGKFDKADIAVRTITSAGQVVAVAIDSDAQETAEIDNVVNAVKEKYPSITKADYSIEVMGAALGKSFFKQTFIALIIAFILMGFVVLVYFRTFVPSLAVILAALSDIVVTLAIFNLTGMKLSTAGIAAFLMLIGYSVDTDILLSSRLLKRKEGSVMDRVYGAMKTGFTMSTTTLVAITVALIFVQSEVVKQIMIILFIGLLVDLVMTWIQNVGILRLYLERKKK